jgi:NADPH:quinone reductase-like Zn-dependent oxidoreductase
MPVAAGALADYVAVGATAVARKPASLGWTEAAVLPLAGLMADQLVEALDGAARQRVLVLGAAGGVGTFTTQLLAARGAEVLGTASADEFGHLREFGVGVPLDRTRPLAGSGRPGAIDAALDTVRALRGGAGGACKTAVEMR